MRKRYNLLGFSPSKLQQLVAELNGKPDYSKRLLQALHQQSNYQFLELDGISNAFKQKLAELCYVELPKQKLVQTSNDKTVKWLFHSQTGGSFETVYIPEVNRATLCISSQVGCLLNCQFCATGKQGFESQLTTAEIIGQVHIVSAFVATQQLQPITNVVFMGMGEPLLNFDNVVDSIQILVDDLAFGLSKYKVTLSTAGIVPKIYQLAQYADIALAISLHAATDKLRNQLVPINQKYSIEQLLMAAKYYIEQTRTSKRHVTIEYTLIADVNDTENDAQQLAQLLQNYPCKINLIPFNTFAASEFKSPTLERVQQFKKILQQHQLQVNVRKTRGNQISAACGQLQGSVINKTRRRGINKMRPLYWKQNQP